MGDKNILAECYGDTLLAKQLNYEYLAYHSGIGEVANQMRKYYSNKKAIAIIDDDKSSQPKYFKEDCVRIASENGVIFMKHKKAEHYVIKISPAFEDFINRAAHEKGMPLFEKDRKKFRDIIKNRELHSNAKFVNYLNRIIQKNPSGIKTLRKFIEQAKREKTAPVRKKTTVKKRRKK